MLHNLPDNPVKMSSQNLAMDEVLPSDGVGEYAAAIAQVDANWKQNKRHGTSVLTDAAEDPNSEFTGIELLGEGGYIRVHTPCNTSNLPSETQMYVRELERDLEREFRDRVEDDSLLVIESLTELHRRLSYANTKDDEKAEKIINEIGFRDAITLINERQTEDRIIGVIIELDYSMNGPAEVEKVISIRDWGRYRPTSTITKGMRPTPESLHLGIDTSDSIPNVIEEIQAEIEGSIRQVFTDN